MKLILYNRVIPKARPRFFNGKAILPKNYRLWKNQAIVDFRSQISKEVHAIEVAKLKIVFHGKHKGDLDNLAGAILDALVDANVLVNDTAKNVPDLMVKYINSQNTYCEVEIDII